MIEGEHIVPSTWWRDSGYNHTDVTIVTVLQIMSEHELLDKRMCDDDDSRIAYFVRYIRPDDGCDYEDYEHMVETTITEKKVDAPSKELSPTVETVLAGHFGNLKTMHLMLFEMQVKLDKIMTHLKLV